MSGLLADVQYAWRMLIKTPVTTAVALLTLALGVGVNTAMFTLVKAEQGAPQHFADVDRLMVITRTAEDRAHVGICPVDCRDWRKQARSFSDIGLRQDRTVTFTGQGEPEQIRETRASANLLPMLGMRPVLGRLHTKEEDAPSAPRVVLLAEKFWQRKFASDPQVLGRTIVLDGKPYTIIGVLPREYSVPRLWYEPDVLTPVRIDPTWKRGEHIRYTSIARLAPGTTVEQARTEMNGIAARLAEAYPATNDKIAVVITPLLEYLVSPSDRAGNLALLAAVGLILLIACANLANLLLAKAASRAREFAMRTALGAGRLRLIRQVLTESLLLALLGGALGVTLGTWVVDALVTWLPDMSLRREEVALSWPVLVHALAISTLAALVFGLAPALLSSRVSVNETLKDGQGDAVGGRARNRLRSALVVGQLAIAMPLLICCGLTLRHLAAYRTVDFGYDTSRLLTLEVELPAHRYATAAQQAAFYGEALERLESVPGIERAGAAFSLPVIRGSVIGARIDIPDFAEQPLESAADVHGCQPVSPGFFETLQAPLVRGRFFAEHDQTDGEPVAVINQRMANRYWPGQDPLGWQLMLTLGQDRSQDRAEPKTLTIVGVVGDIGHSMEGSNPAPPRPTLYVPLAQCVRPDMHLAVRTTGPPKDAVAAARQAIHEIDAGVPVQDFATVDEIMYRFCRDDRMVAAFLAGMAALALSLTCIGLYGVMSYSVVQRTHEIGIRMALGADRGRVLWLVLQRCLRLDALGIVIGLALSVPVGLAIQSLLYRVSGIDPAAYAGVSAVLLAVAALAGYLPARRATKVDPMIALRCE